MLVVTRLGSGVVMTLVQTRLCAATMALRTHSYTALVCAGQPLSQEPCSLTQHSHGRAGPVPSFYR